MSSRSIASSYYPELNDQGFETDSLIIVKFGNLVTGVDDIPNYFPGEIYPNPFKDQFHLQLDESMLKHGVDLKILDVNGREVYGKLGVDPFESITLDGTPSGTYFVQLYSERKSYTIPVIKS